MTRKLKMLGMALVAVLALTAVSASAASAASYTASTYPTTGTAESAVGNGVIKTEAGAIECQTHSEATLKATSPTLTISVKVSGCKAFGFLTATVSMNSCDYVFNEPKGSADSYTATANVSCGATPITVVASTCELTFGAQGPLSLVKLTDNTAAGDVSVQLAIEGIKYTVTKDGIGCPFSGTGEKTGASSTYTNPVTFDSTNGATIDIG
jgi:hypothetical protein